MPHHLAGPFASILSFMSMNVMNTDSAETESARDSARNTPFAPRAVEERMYTSGMRRITFLKHAKKSESPACPSPTSCKSQLKRE